jgi:hypothetical protein
MLPTNRDRVFHHLKKNSMNAKSLIPRRRSLPSVVGGVTLALLTLGVTGCFQPSQDAQALSRSVIKSAGGEWQKQFEVGVGPVTLGLARAGLSFANLDTDVRQALGGLNGADVGVYQLKSGADEVDESAALASADAVMTNRGWDRLLRVSRPGELVAAYVPGEGKALRDLKVCVLVLKQAQLAIISAQSDLEPLMRLAFRKAAQDRQVQSIVQAEAE